MMRDQPVSIQEAESVLKDADACADAVLQAFHYIDLWLAGDIKPADGDLEEQIRRRNQMWGRYEDARLLGLRRLAAVLRPEPCDVDHIGWFETRDIKLGRVSELRGEEPTEPIVVCDPACDRGLMLLDGRHRVVAARMDERTTLPAVFVSRQYVVLWAHFWHVR